MIFAVLERRLIQLLIKWVQFFINNHNKKYFIFLLTCIKYLILPRLRFNVILDFVRVIIIELYCIVLYCMQTYVNIRWHHYQQQEAQLPLRNRASAMQFFFVAKLFSIAVIT